MRLKSLKILFSLVSVVLISVVMSSQAQAKNFRGHKNFRVTITNISSGVQFTQILAATHRSNIAFFELGQKPSNELATIAEGGNIEPLKTLLDSLPAQVAATAQTDGLLNPGQSATIEISTSGRAHFLSLVAMLLPTNDSMVALDSVPLPVWGKRTYYAKGYDAGSEINDELCDSIPGPTCGPSGGEFVEGDGEGYVHISSGIHGIGELKPSDYDWKNPVAKVMVERMR